MNYVPLFCILLSYPAATMPDLTLYRCTTQPTVPTVVNRSIIPTRNVLPQMTPCKSIVWSKLPKQNESQPMLVSKKLPQVFQWLSALPRHIQKMDEHQQFLESKHSNESIDNPYFTFKSYPNPATDRVLIEVEMSTGLLRHSVVELYDESGKVVRNIPCLPRTMMIVEDLPKGNYRIRIKTKDKVHISDAITIIR